MERTKSFVMSFLKKFSFFPLLLLCHPLMASEDVSETLFHHVLNGRALDIFPYVPSWILPAHLTAHLFMLFLSAILIIGLYLPFSKRKILKPGKLQLSLEFLVLFVKDQIVYPVMGEEKGRKWLPFYVTLFIFVLVMNFLGLIPAFKTATGNINVTGALAVIILILTFVIGFKEIGFGQFFKNMFPSGTAWGIGLFVAILEFFSIFTKSMVLAIRLFANMFAGHMAILSFLVLMFIVTPAMGILTVPFAAFTYLLEVLIDLLQALVFTLLSCIFITNASTHE